MNAGVLCCRWIFSALLLMLMFSGACAYADSYSLLSGQGFQRDRGWPVTQTVTFPARDTQSAYVINVYNGGLEEHGLTGDRVSSAVISLNGQVLFRPGDFILQQGILGFVGQLPRNQDLRDKLCRKLDILKLLGIDGGGLLGSCENSGQPPAPLSKTINLQGGNELKVTLYGKPGSVITLEIIGEDSVPPTIIASVVPAANEEGWYKGAVTVSFACDDGASGVKVCPEPVAVSAEGADQVITGTALDYAGNEASASVTLNIDKTLPSIEPLPDPAANSAGWNQSAVTVNFDCRDSLSGVAECSEPATVSGEGAGQVVEGQVRDSAGNTASVSHSLNIDLTPPNIAAALSATANAAGWHRADVGVGFTCDDALSGLVECPTPLLVTTEAANQLIAGTVLDLAGNSGTASVTVNLDKTPPTVTPLPEPGANDAGWHRSAVTVGFDCRDSLSGVAECSSPAILNDEGEAQTVNGQGRDHAGNLGAVTHEFNIDLTPPSISAELSSPANAANWHNADVTVSFVCDDALSGIVECPAPVTVESEAANQEIVGSVFDLAGNSDSASAAVSLDKTPPGVEPLVEPPANDAGWHRSAVTVSFDCRDQLSGVAECSAPVEKGEEGAGQLVEGQGSDIADNTAAASQTLNIDLTAPVIETQFSASPNAAGWHREPVTLTFTCSDNLSGIESCPQAFTLESDVAGHKLEVSTHDLAGNSASQSHELNLDGTAPQIAITAPEAGVELATLQPQIHLALSDNLALDGNSLILSVNGQPFPGQCAIDSENNLAACTPESNFPRGPIQLEAQVTDMAGNLSGAQLDFRIQEDRDGDNVPDVDDLFPDDPTEWADLDGDGIGDNSDPDRDGDGIANDYETQAGTDPDDATSTPPDLDGDGIPDSLDSDRDGDGFSNEEEELAGSNPDDPQDIPAQLFVGISGEPLSTQGQFIDLNGPARGENLKRVYLRSAQFAGIEFAATLSGLDNLTNNNASWQARIPLELGSNAVTAIIENTAGEQASAHFNVQREEVPPVIELIIDTPADNALLTDPGVVITGRVVSEQAVNTPAVQVNGTAAQVTQGGSPTEFAFSSSPLTLNEGANLITVSSVVAGQAMQQSLTLNYQPQIEELPPPDIFVRSPQPGLTLSQDSFTFSAEIQAEAGLAGVTLNGQPVSLTNGNLLQQTVIFSQGQTQIILAITATDNLQQSSSFTAEYHRDMDVPVIQVDQLQPFPVVNTLTENPYTLSGSVSDAALSQFNLNGQPLTLQPTGTAGSYRFSAPLSIAPGPATQLVLEAVDSAGNRSSAEYLLATGSDIQIDWLTPEANSQILLEGAGQTLNVGARLSTTLGVGAVRVEILQAGQPVLAQVMILEAGIASAQLSLPESAGSYTLRIQVLDADNSLLADSSRAIELQLLQALPLQVVKATPADEAGDVEPNGFVAVFFNKPIELAKLELSLHETAHGFTYVDVDPAGTDSLQAKGYVLQQINREHEAVPGVISLLPNDTTALFYPQRDLAYAADLYLSVSYDGTELLRRHFRTRPRPTFIEGVVQDNLGQPVVNAQVTLPELKRTVTTNSDGAFSFGYGDPAAQTLPGGNYRLLVNTGLKDTRFGSYAGQVNIEAGARNQVNSIQLPLLNQNIPFSNLNSGAVSVINGGELTLDASAASYSFGDGREQGATHVQFLPRSSMREQVFDPRYAPLWSYSLQPKGIAVQGQLAVEFALPKFQGTYDYAPGEDELVLLLGNSADGTRLVPVGVGQTLAGQRIASAGETKWQTLDYIAYARVIPEQWADLRAYREGQISLDTLTLRLQTYRFVPPANEAEAEQRAAEIAEAQL